MRRPSVVFLFVVAATGCKVPRMMTPADLGPVADEIAVSNRSRASGVFANETFAMGAYPVTRVHRGGTSTESSGFKLAGLGKESSSSKAFYDYDMSSPVGLYKGSCGVRASSESTQVGNWVVGGSGSQVLDCNCSGAGPGVTRAYLELAPQIRGALVHRSGAAAPLQPATAEGGGSAFSVPVGFEAGGTPPLGAVETVHPGRVWINRALGPGERADLACLFAGLLLYRTPDAAP